MNTHEVILSPEAFAQVDDLRPGLRTVAFERRLVIAYAVAGDAVEILAIAYGGRAVIAPTD